MRTKVIIGASALIIGSAIYFSLRDDVDKSVSSVAAAHRPEERQRRALANRWSGLVNEAIPRETRLEMAGKIDVDASPVEVAFLFDSLNYKGVVGNQEVWWVVMNEIMEQMRKKGVGGDQYSARLINLISDGTTSEVTRDYAIQHLGQWISPAMPETSPGELDRNRISEALDSIVSAIKDPSLGHTSIPGTGLLTLADALPRLDASQSESVWAQLETFMKEAIEGRTSGSISFRTSVIQVAARSGNQKFLPSIRDLIDQPGQNPSILLSSVAALGIYRQEADRPLLTQIVQSNGPFQYAAKAALESLNQPSTPAVR